MSVSDLLVSKNRYSSFLIRCESCPTSLLENVLKVQGKVQWARSIGPKFPEIQVQNQMEGKVLENRFEDFGQPLEVVLFP